MTNKIIWLLAGMSAVATSAAFAADARRGEQLYQDCASCHTDSPDGFGPNLQGVVGRKVGARTDYRYSAAMQHGGFVWDDAKLHAFIHDPDHTVKGTKMPYAGMTSDRDIDDLVAYIKTLK